MGDIDIVNEYLYPSFIGIRASHNNGTQLRQLVYGSHRTPGRVFDLWPRFNSHPPQPPLSGPAPCNIPIYAHHVPSRLLPLPSIKSTPGGKWCQVVVGETTRSATAAHTCLHQGCIDKGEETLMLLRMTRVVELEWRRQVTVTCWFLKNLTLLECLANSFRRVWIQRASELLNNLIMFALQGDELFFLICFTGEVRIWQIVLVKRFQTGKTSNSKLRIRLPFRCITFIWGCAGIFFFPVHSFTNLFVRKFRVKLNDSHDSKHRGEIVEPQEGTAVRLRSPKWHSVRSGMVGYDPALVTAWPPR